MKELHSIVQKSNNHLNIYTHMRLHMYAYIQLYPYEYVIK